MVTLVLVLVFFFCSKINTDHMVDKPPPLCIRNETKHQVHAYDITKSHLI